MKSNYEVLLEYALRVLSKKRYTSVEIRNKLEAYCAKKRIEQNEITAVFERLFELKYLDDMRFSEDFINDRIKFKPRGKFLIARELRRRGIDKKMVRDAIENSNIDEFSVALEALKKRERQWTEIDPQKKKEKAFRFLASRGFNIETIYKTIEYWYSVSVE